ncbi:MAG: superoxide dismutase [Chitinophagaceae bacterium]|nr:superoxide dismutase [Chitinophagaceae bacterium]
MAENFTHRRTFLKTSAIAATGWMVFPSLSCSVSAKTSAAGRAEDIPFEQRPLPYSYQHLEPTIDALTMEIHYTRHAAGYAKNLADALKDEGVNTQSVSLKELLTQISKYSSKMRNNGGGHYNHEFFWASLKKPSDNNLPPAELNDVLQKHFGSFDNFRNQFSEAARNRFGSGWAWLVKTPDGKLKIGSTPNQDNPLMDVSELKGTPLLGLDVWEHAYYLKYQNRRNDYITAWWTVVNWDVVLERLKKS